MYCEKCGIPTGIASGNVWYEGGFVSGRFPPYSKGTFFDVDELNHLFDTLADQLGYDIGDILAGGKYHDAKEYISALVGRMRESLGGKLPEPEALFGAVLMPTRIWGLADPTIVAIGPEELVLDVKNPYSIPLFCGDVAAANDALRGTETKAEWEGGTEKGTLTLVPSDAYASVDRRIEEESLIGVKPEGDELECERCEACGAPAAVGDLLRWDPGSFKIFEHATGRRYCYNNTNGVNAVLRLLAEELGEDVNLRMMEIVREHSRGLYAGLAAGVDPGVELSGFVLRGWGRAEARTSGKERSVEVTNPYSHILLAGRIWGLEEASGGERLRIAGMQADGDRLLVTFAAPY